MDEIVKLALEKWPNVPDCYGWLGLDSRGDWYLRDDLVQSKGEFTKSKGSRLEHRKLIEFINRNYAQDTDGSFYFQNGPQKVYVELELTPWILKFDHENNLMTHTQLYIKWKNMYTDEVGRVYVDTDLGIGLIHTMEMSTFADQLLKEKWTLNEVKIQDLESTFGFVKSPSQKKSQSLTG